jgi:small subunit ribosomal protein S18
MPDEKEAPGEKETIEEEPRAEAVAAGQPDEKPPEAGAAAQPDEGPQPEATADSEREEGPPADSEREEGPPPEPAESEPAGPPRPTMAAAGPTMAAAGPPRRSAPPRDRGERGDRGERDERGPRRFGRRRVCAFCVDKVTSIDYKDSVKLRRYLSDRARIDPRRKTGTCAKHQRWLTTALKRARHLALLPYTSEHMRMTGSFASRR